MEVRFYPNVMLERLLKSIFTPGIATTRSDLFSQTWIINKSTNNFRDEISANKLNFIPFYITAFNSHHLSFWSRRFEMCLIDCFMELVSFRLALPIALLECLLKSIFTPGIATTRSDLFSQTWIINKSTNNFRDEISANKLNFIPFYITAFNSHHLSFWSRRFEMCLIDCFMELVSFRLALPKLFSFFRDICFCRFPIWILLLPFFFAFFPSIWVSKVSQGAQISVSAQELVYSILNLSFVTCMVYFSYRCRWMCHWWWQLS